VAARKLPQSRRELCASPRIRSQLSIRFSSYSAADATAGTTRDGAVPAGTGAAIAGAAAWAGVVRSDGTAGADREFTALASSGQVATGLTSIGQVATGLAPTGQVVTARVPTGQVATVPAPIGPVGIVRMPTGRAATDLVEAIGRAAIVEAIEAIGPAVVGDPTLTQPSAALRRVA